MYVLGFVRFGRIRNLKIHKLPKLLNFMDNSYIFGRLFTIYALSMVSVSRIVGQELSGLARSLAGDELWQCHKTFYFTLKVMRKKDRSTILSIKNKFHIGHFLFHTKMRHLFNKVWLFSSPIDVEVLTICLNCWWHVDVRTCSNFN